MRRNEPPRRARLAVSCQSRTGMTTRTDSIAAAPYSGAPAPPCDSATLARDIRVTRDAEGGADATLYFRPRVTSRKQLRALVFPKVESSARRAIEDAGAGGCPFHSRAEHPRARRGGLSNASATACASRGHQSAATAAAVGLIGKRQQTSTARSAEGRS